MALTESTMMPLGASAPDFRLADFDGGPIELANFSGHPLLVMFICNHCPYVKHVAPELARLGNDYAGTELKLVAIQSNDVEAYPDDGPEAMKAEIELRGYSFPYLWDADQEVAKAFTAACTPDFFLFDRQHRLAYRGQLDTSRPTRIKSGVYESEGNEPTGKDLRDAIEAVLADTAVQEKQFPSAGCNIKWKPGNEPDYAK